MSSSHRYKRPRQTDDTQSDRLVALQRFVKGDRVRHRITRKVGSFIESHSGFALPEVWVQFDSQTDIQVPISCNPLDLELVARDCDQPNSAITPQIEVNAAPTLCACSNCSREVTSTRNACKRPVPGGRDSGALPSHGSEHCIDFVDELTEQEERDRHRLERRVEKAFYEAGKALAELRSRRLYRSTHKTFEAYCRERFGYTRQSANYLIAGADVFENLTTNGCQTLPTNERQVRSLAVLSPEQQCEVWQQALEEAGGKIPSGRIVKGIVEQLKEKPLVLNKEYCQVGDVFTLVRLEGKERKYNGCSCVAIEPRDFTVIVDVHDTTLSVKPENLNKIDSPEAHRQLPQILHRIRRVRQVPGFRDRAAYMVLEHLGKQTYLTPLEDKLLQVIEQEYGVEEAE